MTDRGAEWLDVVDADNRVVGSAPRADVHGRGLLHRSVHVLLVHPDGRIYVQQRALDKDCSPGLWDTSAAGHVDRGEAPDAAAARELGEELGLHDVALEHWFDMPASEVTGNEFVSVYRARTAAEPVPDPVEIAAAGWEDVQRLAAAVAANPAAYTGTFRCILERYRREG